MHTTPGSLLVRLRQPDRQRDWDRFVNLYTPLLFHWALRLGLQQSDAADLVQEVFLVLVRKLPEFSYQPDKRFRGWLWTITCNKYRERRRRRAAQPQAGSPADLEELPAPTRNEELEEEEYRKYLARRALELMQADFQPATFKACWDCIVLGRPPAEVATELGISVNALHLRKTRVLQRLREELAGLLN